jgi:hypothetical protein
VASYDGATLKVTELFSIGHSTANVCLWRLHGCVLDVIQLSATGVAEIAKSTNLKGCPPTYGHVLYVKAKRNVLDKYHPLKPYLFLH